MEVLNNLKVISLQERNVYFAYIYSRHARRMSVLAAGIPRSRGKIILFGMTFYIYLYQYIISIIIRYQIIYSKTGPAVISSLPRDRMGGWQSFLEGP